MSREAMQMALEALESDPISHAGLVSRKQAITALRQALEEKQEPFEYWSVAGGWVKLDEMREHFEIAGCGTIYKSAGEGRVPLYTAPKQWVGWNAALAQQEPVAWISEGGDVSRSKRYMDEMGFKCNPLYTTPQKREWVGLTLNEAEEFYEKYTDRAELINAVDKFLEEKNT